MQAMKIRISGYLLAAMLAVPAAAQEEDPDWYTVEIIVFLHRDDASSVEERWTPEPGYPGIKDARDLVAPTRPPVLQAYEQVPPDERRLQPTLRTLERSARYRPLLHTGWRQPGLSRNAAAAVRIDDRSGNPLPATALKVNLPPDVEGDRAREPGPEAGTEPTYTAPHVRILDPEEGLDPALLDEADRKRTLAGNVRLYEERFLHIETDLLYISEDELDMQSEFSPGLAELSMHRPARQAFRLQESRRVEAGDLHYFDHPEFGVIALVYPLDEEEVERRRDNYEIAFRAALLEREASRLLERDGNRDRD